MTDLARATATVIEATSSAGVGCALVGGFAVSIRTEPRFTRDVDFAVAADGDPQAEEVTREFVGEGHEVFATVEQEATGRLAMVRIRLTSGGTVDLLFASSGIEAEIVAGADAIEVLPELTVPVASVGHLVALKLLSQNDDRPSDSADLAALRSVADDDDFVQADAAVRLIEDRGYGRGRDLVGDLDRWHS